jgi:hypothetical protein
MQVDLLFLPARVYTNEEEDSAMHPRYSIHFILIVAVVLLVQSLDAAPLADDQLSREQQEEFLLHAKVIRSRKTGEGKTNPYRLTLSDGNIEHDASFQTVFVRENYRVFEDGTTEMNYVDSYLYNIAAYRLARMLGLEDMMPVTVERKCLGEIGSLSWWLSVQMNERERTEKNIDPPDLLAHNKQKHKMRVFSELVYDSDRNDTNVLIGENWELYMIDFSRAFRLYRDLKDARNLEYCDRDLFSKLQQLDQDAVLKETKGFLTKDEVKAVMARRDLIVGIFKKMIEEKGEGAVLYD